MSFFLLNLLRTPSSFETDPWGFLRNQVLHGWIVGGGGVLLFTWLAGLSGLPYPSLWGLLTVGMAYWVWETVQLRFFSSDLWDGIEDLAFVMIAACAAIRGDPLYLMLQSLFLMSGFLRRKTRRDNHF